MYKIVEIFVKFKPAINLQNLLSSDQLPFVYKPPTRHTSNHLYLSSFYNRKVKIILNAVKKKSKVCLF
jgi:hypothetical protein